MNRSLLSILFILLLATSASAQYTTVTNLSGTVAYGPTSVTVTSAGAVSSTPYCGVNPYWVGSFSGSTTPSPGSYTFSFSPAVSAIRVYCTAMDVGISTSDTEKIGLTINGTFYTLTPANFTVYPGTCGQPAAAIIGGWMDAVVDMGAGAGGQLDVTGMSISTCKVETNGFDNGTTFTFQFIGGGPTSNGPLCAGDTLKLYWNGDSTGATYAWSGPGGFTSTMQDPVIPWVTVADTGVYNVIKTVGLVHDTAQVRVVIKPSPVVIATSNSPICQGVSNTLDLFANPDSLGETYSWTGPNSFSSTLQNPSFTGFVALDTGIYQVIATWNGCKDTGYTHVILAPVPPPPVITGVTTYCTGDVFVPFTVTGAAILWYTSGTGGVGTAIAPVVNTAIPGTHTYWASQTILGCESNRDSITVTVHTTPAPPVITGTTVYCQYYTYVPPTATGLNILWYTTAAGGIGTLTPAAVNTNIPGTYTLYATQTDSGCTSPRAPFVITVNPKPVPPVITNTPGNYCPGQAFAPFVALTGSGILWYTTAVGGVGGPVPPAVNTAIPGIYTVWATQTVLGCESDRSSAIVTVYDSVIAGFNWDLKYGCKADTVVFTNTSYQATNYVWDFGDGASSISKDPTHIYLWQDVNTVKLFARSATCIDSSIQTIDMVHPIKAQFVSDTDLICQGSAINFTDLSVGTTLSYTWYFGDGATSNSASPAHTYPRTGVYKVMEVITDFVPCMDTAYKVVSVDTISPLSISVTDTVICTGTYITFTGNYSSIGNTGITWSMGNGDSIKDENPVRYGYGTVGTFIITAKALYRVCPEPSASRSVTVIPPPVISLGPDTTICKGSQALVLADRINAGKAGATWSWNTGANTSSISVTEPGTYIATVTIDGCEAQGSVKVDNDCYMNVPNVFTPNGDGLNDYFYPRQYLTSGLSGFKMSIYNRWGVLIFETNALKGAGWDGKFNNTDQPSGVYVYIIDATFKDGQKEHHQGNVTLLR